jgi:translation initiation factor IF-2
MSFRVPWNLRYLPNRQRYHALLAFLEDSKIPVCDVAIGEVHKKHVKRAQIMKDKRHPEYAVILAFDVKISSEAKNLAETVGVQIMPADIIYHLFDQFTAYMKKVREKAKTETKSQAVFPVIMRIIPQYVFNKKDPIIVGCDIIGGVCKIGTPICVPAAGNLSIGRIISIEENKKPVQEARKGKSVCIKIQPDTNQTHITIGRHFESSMELYSQITRDSIDQLKENFKDEMQNEDWQLIIQLKKLFEIQ